jgi:stage III sporulation protein AC
LSLWWTWDETARRTKGRQGGYVVTPEVRAIFQIAGIGFLVAILHTILKQSGKEEFANWTTFVGFVAVFVIVIGYVDNLYSEIQRVFLQM